MKNQDPLLNLPPIEDDDQTSDRELLVNTYRAVRELVSQMYELKKVVFGNGEVGLTERVRGLERTVGLIVKIGIGIGGILGAGILLPMALSAVYLLIQVIGYVYPLLEK